MYLCREPVSKLSNNWPSLCARFPQRSDTAGASTALLAVAASAGLDAEPPAPSVPRRAAPLTRPHAPRRYPASPPPRRRARVVRRRVRRRRGRHRHRCRREQLLQEAGGEELEEDRAGLHEQPKGHRSVPVPVQPGGRGRPDRRGAELVLQGVQGEKCKGVCDWTSADTCVASDDPCATLKKSKCKDECESWRGRSRSKTTPSASDFTKNPTGPVRSIGSPDRARTDETDDDRSRLRIRSTETGCSMWKRDALRVVLSRCSHTPSRPDASAPRAPRSVAMDVSPEALGELKLVRRAAGRAPTRRRDRPAPAAHRAHPRARAPPPRPAPPVFFERAPLEIRVRARARRRYPPPPPGPHRAPTPSPSPPPPRRSRPPSSAQGRPREGQGPAPRARLRGGSRPAASPPRRTAPSSTASRAATCSPPSCTSTSSGPGWTTPGASSPRRAASPRTRRAPRAEEGSRTRSASPATRRTMCRSSPPSSRGRRRTARPRGLRSRRRSSNRTRTRTRTRRSRAAVAPGHRSRVRRAPARPSSARGGARGGARRGVFDDGGGGVFRGSRGYCRLLPPCLLSGSGLGRPFPPPRT